MSFWWPHPASRRQTSLHWVHMCLGRARRPPPRAPPPPAAAPGAGPPRPAPHIHMPAACAWPRGAGARSNNAIIYKRHGDREYGEHTPSDACTLIVISYEFLRCREKNWEFIHRQNHLPNKLYTALPSTISVQYSEGRDNLGELFERDRARAVFVGKAHHVAERAH